MKRRFLALVLVVCIASTALMAGCGTSATGSSVAEQGVSDWGSITTEQMSVAENSESVISSAIEESKEIIESSEIESAEESVVEESNDESMNESVVAETSVTEDTTENSISIPEDDAILEIDAEIEEEDMTTTQRNSLNMLNYITVLTQEIHESKSSRISLESIQSSILENIYLNAVDTKTQSQISSLWNTIEDYRMIEVKRERIEYIYEQNKAQAMREAVPDPMALLSAVQSGSYLKMAASVLYMAVDSVASYESASSQADLEYIQNGWELEDAERKALSDSRLGLFNYMVNVVRDNGFPAEYSLTEEAVNDFVKWSNEDNLVRKISWLESNEEKYKEFRTYWLELAESYYNTGEYVKCMEAIDTYEDVATRIFRLDYDYAETLPMAIISAKEELPEEEYIAYAEKYTKIIIENCDAKDWALRYFVAQIKLDLYGLTNDKVYLEDAYKIAKENVVEHVDEQEKLNEDYLKDIEEVQVAKDATKREKQETKEYNKLIEEQRSVELPPVNEAFYLNCDLLFALAEELNISADEKEKLDDILHENGQSIFLTEVLDNRFWAAKAKPGVDSETIEIVFDGDTLSIPASCITDRGSIKIAISDGTILDDWTVEKVDRPKDSKECSEFVVVMKSETGKEHKYVAGEKITITVTPVDDNPDETIVFEYEVIEKKTLGFIKGVNIERVME